MSANIDNSNTRNIVENTRSKAITSAPHVVIIGAGFGGLQAARALGKAPVRVTVIDRTNHHLFQPLLYWVATAGLSPADICTPIRHILKKQKNTEVLMSEVTGIDVQEQQVLLHDQSIRYDYLIVATGSGDNYFGHEAWAQVAPGLKSIEDARAIRRKILRVFEHAEFESAELQADPTRVRELLTFVLIGAGPTGVEMAGAIAELSHNAFKADFRHIDPSVARILLLEAGPRILPAFPESLAQKSQRRLARMGVEVRTGVPVTGIDETGVTVGEEYISAPTIIWTAGVKASPAGQWLGAEVDRGGRVKVEGDLTLPHHPNIFVVGDTASVIQDGKPLPGVAQVAIQAGHYAASVIVDRVTQGSSATVPFHYHDKGNLATVGRSYAIADIGKLRLTGLLAWLLWLVVHIFFLIGFRNRFITVFQWAWTYLTYERGARIII